MHICGNANMRHYIYLLVRKCLTTIHKKLTSLDVGCVKIEMEPGSVQSYSDAQKEKQQNDWQGTARHKKKQMLATIMSSPLKTKKNKRNDTDEPEPVAMCLLWSLFLPVAAAATNCCKFYIDKMRLISSTYCEVGTTNHCTTKSASVQACNLLAGNEPL